MQICGFLNALSSFKVYNYIILNINWELIGIKINDDPLPEKGGTKTSIPSNPIFPQWFFTH
jgi:hypothetical protein